MSTMDQSRTKTDSPKKISRSAKGAFLQGTWHCDCDPRLPAEHFQVKNGGRHHGRWFYTCQKAQHKRCAFFLWDDDAKGREKRAVLSNARSEPHTPPRKVTAQCETPSTRSTRPEERINTPATTVAGDEFDWSSSNDEELAALELPPRDAEARNVLPETPRKAIRTHYTSTPSKRNYDGTERWRTPQDQDDVFVTSKGNGLPTPIKLRESGDLAHDALHILKPVHLSADMESELVALLQRQELRVKGITKGREISREALKAKDKQIADLTGRIAVLEAERETNRAVIAHLKHDMSDSAGKGKRKP